MLTTRLLSESAAEAQGKGRPFAPLRSSAVMVAAPPGSQAGVNRTGDQSVTLQSPDTPGAA